jgi:hypothetical protein
MELKGQTPFLALSQAYDRGTPATTKGDPAMAPKMKKKATPRRPAPRGSAKAKKKTPPPRKPAARIQRPTESKAIRNMPGRAIAGDRLREVNPEQRPNQPGIGERMDEGYRLSQEGQEGSSVPMADVLESQEHHRRGNINPAKELNRKINNPSDDSGEEETTTQSGDI